MDDNQKLGSKTAKNGFKNKLYFKLLAEKVFQPIRDHFGVPIRISSGYRSKDLNTAVGGSLSSQHCTGEAIDIDMDGTTITNAQIFNFIKDSRGH